MYFAYILECGDTTLYTGIATNVARRFKEHQNGKGGHYTRARGVTNILYVEKCKDRSSALKREAEIKKWSRAKKFAFIEAFSNCAPWGARL